MSSSTNFNTVDNTLTYMTDGNKSCVLSKNDYKHLSKLIINFYKSKNSEQETIFHYIIKNYSQFPSTDYVIKVLEYILPDFKDDINKKNISGTTPVLLAGKLKLYPICEFLENNGADITIPNNEKEYLSVRKDNLPSNGKLEYIKMDIIPFDFPNEEKNEEKEDVEKFFQSNIFDRTEHVKIPQPDLYTDFSSISKSDQPKEISELSTDFKTIEQSVMPPPLPRPNKKEQLPSKEQPMMFPSELTRNIEFIPIINPTPSAPPASIPVSPPTPLEEKSVTSEFLENVIKKGGRAPMERHEKQSPEQQEKINNLRKQVYEKIKNLMPNLTDEEIRNRRTIAWLKVKNDNIGIVEKHEKMLELITNEFLENISKSDEDTATEERQRHQQKREIRKENKFEKKSESEEEKPTKIKKTKKTKSKKADSETSEMESGIPSILISNSMGTYL